MKKLKKLKLKQQINRMTAVVLIATVISGTISSESMAGKPTVDTDEALYVNLDYYGQQTDSSIVKGCSLNGIRTFTDYGTYTNITNMSNYAVPKMMEGGVTWELPSDSKERFYYECQLESGSVILPWDFDISYRLNGIPVEAEKLANADGLVEMDIVCMPNHQANEYYQNNMLLQVGTLVNMEDVSSICAPGSQTQSVGTYKAIIFAALPGEEKTFHIEIGTSRFESMGVIMMMIPGTLDQMKEIKDIKELKDNFSDSANDLVDSMNDMLSKMNALMSGMDTAESGLKTLQEAREGLDAGKDEMSADVENSLDSLDALSGQIGNVSSDINADRDALDALSDQLDIMVSTIRDSGESFSKLSGCFGDLKSSLEDLQGAVASSDGNAVEGILTDLNTQLDGIDETMGQITDMLNSVGDPADLSEEEQKAVIAGLKSQSQDLLSQLAGIVGEAQVAGLKKQLDALDKDNITGNYHQLVQTLKKYQQSVDAAGIIVQTLRAAMGGYTEDALSTGRRMAYQLGNIMSDIESLMINMNDLNSVMHDNKSSLYQTLDNAAAISDQLEIVTDSLVHTLQTVRDLIQKNRSNLENGTKQTLDGLIDILQEATSGSATEKIKDANNGLKNSIQDELDQVEGDTNLLNLNTEESMISFTSDQNPEPASIQIILRSQEISEDKVNDNAVDIEPAVEQPDLWTKIVNVFLRIWEKITGFFK